MDEPGTGPRVAIKDLIDVAGHAHHGRPAGCSPARPSRPSATPPAWRGLRAADVAIVGKTNLHELACGGTGVNPHFGTPTNPFDPACIPGGSSSGSAVALADGEVDIALGSDTAGSIRNPSACCGTAGLKTTWGRIPLDGVWPLAPSLDTVGPMARDVAGVIEGMALLEPGLRGAAGAVTGDRSGAAWPTSTRPSTRRSTRRWPPASSRWSRSTLPGWDAASDAGWAVMFHEYWVVDHHLYEQDRGGLGDDIVERIEQGRDVTLGGLPARPRPARRVARRAGGGVRAGAGAGVAHHRDVPHAASTSPVPNTRRTNLPVNHAGHPSLALPIPAGGRFPASVQLVGPDHSEDLLCATGLVVEAAARSLS